MKNFPHRGDKVWFVYSSAKNTHMEYHVAEGKLGNMNSFCEWEIETSERTPVYHHAEEFIFPYTQDGKRNAIACAIDRMQSSIQMSAQHIQSLIEENFAYVGGE